MTTLVFRQYLFIRLWRHCGYFSFVTAIVLSPVGMGRRQEKEGSAGIVAETTIETHLCSMAISHTSLLFPMLRCEMLHGRFSRSLLLRRPCRRVVSLNTTLIAIVTCCMLTQPCAASPGFGQEEIRTTASVDQYIFLTPVEVSHCKIPLGYLRVSHKTYGSRVIRPAKKKSDAGGSPAPALSPADFLGDFGR
jgi:hypothetical protein